MTKSYSIRDNAQPNGKVWSKGGTGSVWSKSRKVWGALGPFKNHLSLYYPFSYSWQQRGAPSGFYPGTLIPQDTKFPYGGEECVIIEVDEAANTVKEFPAAAWIWNNVYFPRYQREHERTQDRIREQLGVQGEIVLTMLEPVHVEAVNQVHAFDPLTEKEIAELVDKLPKDHSVVELVRAVEDAVHKRIVTQRSKM